MTQMNLVLVFLLLLNTITIGQSWQQAVGIRQNEYIFDLATINNYVFAATESGVYRSSDNGQNWEVKNNGIPTANGLGAHAFSISENKIYVANIYGVFVSNDFGENWTDLNLPEQTYSLSVFVDNEVILAGVPGGGLYRSTNNGVTWNGVTADHIYKISKIDNYYFAGSDDVVYSDDLGLTWQSANFNKFAFWTFSMNDTTFACPIEGGIEKTAPDNISWQTVIGITARVTGILNRNDTILAVTTNNVQYTKYSKKNEPWKTITTNGLPELGINVLNASAICNNYLIVGTSNENITGLGVWYIDMSGIFTSVNEIEVANSITVFPNPASDIIFVNGLNENAKISIYDLSGRLLFSKQVTNKQIDISNFQSGIYTMKIETSKEIVTKKFVKQ